MNKQFLRISIWVAFYWLFLITVAITATAQCTYDTLNRLIKVQYGDGTVIQYTYDAVGNRLTQEVQAFSGDAVAAEKGAPGSVPVSLAAPGPVSSAPEAALLGGAASASAPGTAWFALLTKIRLAASGSDLANLQAEIRNFLDGGGFSPEEKSRYQNLAAQEVEARADFIQRTAAGGGKGTGMGSPGGTPRQKDGTSAPIGNKILQDKGKIYTSGPEAEMEKPKP